MQTLYFLSVLLLINAVTAIRLDKDSTRKTHQTLGDAAEEQLNKRVVTLETHKRREFSSAMLNEHNRLRKEEALSANAAYMYKMAYDRKLAKAAQSHANKCKWSHSGPGENMLLDTRGRKTVESVVENWYKEKLDYTISSNTCRAGKKCGHYTQVVWAKSKFLGCGMKRCPRLETTNRVIRNAYFVVCQYKPFGNYRGVRPYNIGSSTCEKCPNNCVESALCETSYTVPVCKNKIGNCKELDDKHRICTNGTIYYESDGVAYCQKHCQICNE